MLQKSIRISGWNRVLSSFAQSFVGRFLGKCRRWMALSLSASSEAARMVFARWFGVCMLLMCSNSAPGKFLVYDNTRRVGSLACVASCASLGQWWYVFAILFVWV